MARLIRVFPVRTSYTPTDAFTFVGYPPLWRPQIEDVDEVHVSVVFTWHLEAAHRLADAWRQYYPVVRIGGPALGGPGGEFIPGRYVKAGVVFTSRGCIRRCPWCLVPIRDGHLRLLSIQPGYIVNDDNFLACPKLHREAVYVMLRQQSRAAVFAGGLDTRLVTDEVAEELRSLRVGEVFLACDSDAAINPLRDACQRLAFLGRRKLRCYVLAAFDSETIGQAERRLEAVWEAGTLPFCQLYQPAKGERIDYSADWRLLQKRWSRPAATKAMHQEERA